MNLVLVIGIVGVVACSAWFAVLAARTDRRENNPYDWADDKLDFIRLPLDAREEVSDSSAPPTPDFEASSRAPRGAPKRSPESAPSGPGDGFDTRPPGCSSATK